MSIDKSSVTIFKLIWDCEFYYRLLISISKIKDNGISTLLSSIILREFTVFIQEMSKYAPDIEKAILEDTSKVFKDSYQSIRDRIHYFTSQPFDYLAEKSNAENIIQNLQAHHLTRPIDSLSAFRYDLSYIKVGNMVYFSSLDVNMLACGTPLEKDGRIIGDVLKQYSTDLSSIIANIKRGFTVSEIDGLINLGDLCLNGAASNIEFYDGKFDVAVSRSGFPEYLTAISLRILSDVGSLRYMVEELFADEWVNTYHLYFFTRLIAIRFDEISDAIYVIDKDFPGDESNAFIELLKTNGIYPFPDDIRLIAKKLRNSIHYNPSGEIWSIDFNKSFYWHQNFLKQASTKSSLLANWPDDYLILKDKMLAHLELLHKLLSEIYDFQLKQFKE